MPAPTIPAAAYVDNAVPNGSRYINFKSGGSTGGGSDRGYFAAEAITPSRPTKRILRPDPSGAPNGFALIIDQETLTTKVQLATSATQSVQRGWWFNDTFNALAGAETFVVADASDKYEMGNYWYQDLTLLKAYTPAS